MREQSIPPSGRRQRAPEEADRLFFERNPLRHYYVRKVTPAERKQAARAGKRLGADDVVIIERLRLGRLRAFGIAAHPGIDIDAVPEAKAKELFFARCDQQTLDLRALLI
jgi:hypothetical protein